MTNPNEEEECNASSARGNGRNTRKMSEPREYHQGSDGGATAVSEDSSPRSLASPSPSGAASPMSEESCSSVLEEIEDDHPQTHGSNTLESGEKNAAINDKKEAPVNLIVEGEQSGEIESKKMDEVQPTDLKIKDCAAKRSNSTNSEKILNHNKINIRRSNSLTADDASDDKDNTSSIKTQSENDIGGGDRTQISAPRNTTEEGVTGDAAFETTPLVDQVQGNLTPVVETKASTVTKSNAVAPAAEPKRPTAEEKANQASSPTDDGGKNNTTPASKENGNVLGGTEFSRQVFGRVQRSISVDCRPNGDAASSVDKPKRIFQKPPEEYLPIVGEDEEDCDSLYGGLPTPPDGGWGWMVVFASFMIHVFADGFTYTLGIFYVHLLDYFEVGKAAAAWIVSILVGVTLGSGPISGALVNRFGCQTVTIGGGLLASFMLFVSVYATNIVTLYFTIGLGAGMGFGLIYLPAIVCVTCYFEKKRSFATGIAVCGSGLGTFIFSPLVEALIRYYNWKGALIIISGLVLNCVFFGALFRPLEDTRPKRPRLRNQRSNEGAHPDDCFLPPKIQVTDGDHVVRPNMSDESLGAHGPIARRPLRHQVTGSLTPEALDMQRIKSHGNLNPVLAHLRQTDALRMTASQPLFQGVEGTDHSLSPSPSRMGSQSVLMTRKDVFYSGSILNIPEYKRSPSHYRESIMIRPADIEQFKDNNKMCGCIPCSKEAKAAMNSLMDFGLLKDPIFQMFALSNFFTSIGFYAPYVFIVDRALEWNIDPNKTATLLAVVGISNTVSRVVLGYISDLPRINRLYLYNFALTICGIGTCCSIWMQSFSSQVFYAALFGSTSGAYVGLTSVVLVDLLGMERLTNAFGLLLLFQGIASVVGPPICGSLYEFSKNYNLTFLLAGFMIAISGVMLFAVPCLQRRVKRKEDEAVPTKDCDDVHV